jgi:GNAT superfamily N-acetyltransferase
VTGLRLVIRESELDDAKGVAQVNVDSWQAAYPGLLDQKFLDSMDVDGRTLSWQRILHQRRGKVLVAEEEGSIVGFCAVGPAIDDDWGEVFAIYVGPRRWGRGIGRDLLIAGEQALVDAGYSRGLLWVLQGNTRARVFYERQGWALGKPIRIEAIGGIDVTEVRYEKALTPL